MKVLRNSVLLAAVIFAATAQQVSAQSLASKFPILLGTTGACNNEVPGGPCTTQSRLVLLNPRTGALIRDIGPIGFTVNGLAWDGTSGKLYATTPSGDLTFHG